MVPPREILYDERCGLSSSRSSSRHGRQSRTVHHAPWQAAHHFWRLEIIGAAKHSGGICLCNWPRSVPSDDVYLASRYHTRASLPLAVWS
ncbi:hypothetical protein A0H81_11748 [Grifola frondosa]|uniref:Uncharacterized protein n=1 Tax=Grifola frondosa TaxID=5627 RepID=A0A1C7LUD8_GRIFR|nr:hypothetical protein A0H81_11748 [Grifola frondosa]